jgi:hypothetical protein
MTPDVPDSQARMVKIDEHTEVYLVENQSLEELLFNRGLVEVEFRRACLQSSRLFLRHILEELTSSPVSELLILSKGLVYQLGEAFARETGRNLPTNLIATTRVEVEGESAKIDVPYTRFDAEGDRLVVGDTVASGSTLIAALDEYRLHCNLSHIYLLSYAGSVPGAKAVTGYCRDHRIHLLILYGLAAFGLGENGFDLSFLHPDTVTNPRYVERARALYRGRQVSSIGWDFGSQMIAPDKYRKLSWVEGRILGVDENAFGSVVPVSSADEVWREKDAFKQRSRELWPEA